MSVATTSSASGLSCPPPRFGTPRRLDRPTHGGELAVIARALGTPLMPWQQHVADVALEVDPQTGRLAYRRVVLTVPRQSGKTTLLLALFMWRALSLNGPQTMAFTAQNALDARMRLQREWHKTLQLTAMRDTYRTSWSTGAEALLFHNGSRLQAVASTEKSGHGMTLDLAVVDEAFAQPDGRLEQALSPAMLTRPEPQLWFVSTAGAPSDRWFRAKVEHGRASVSEPMSGVAFFEWSAPNEVDPGDRAAWRDCMPALGHTVSEAVIAAECLGLPTDEFRRAYLNQWVDRATEGAFDPAAWSALVDTTAAQAAGAWGVAVAPDQSWAALSVAWKRPDGQVQAEVVDYRPGTSWLPQRLAEVQGRWGGTVYVDRFAAPLVDGTSVGGTAYEAACAAFAAAVASGSLRHGNQGELNTAVKAARWRSSGDGRVLDRKGTVDISPLVAAVLAMHGLSTSSTTGGWVLSL